MTRLTDGRALRGRRLHPILCFAISSPARNPSAFSTRYSSITIAFSKLPPIASPPCATPRIVDKTERACARNFLDVRVAGEIDFDHLLGRIDSRVIKGDRKLRLTRSTVRRAHASPSRNSMGLTTRANFFGALVR